MADVKLDHVTKIFGGRVVAVDNITLHIRDGEFFVLLGPSGCGKTTTLRIIAGLEKPTAGRVYIGGVDVTDLPPKDRDVAMVFQSYALYPHMTVYDNIAFPLKIRKMPKHEIDRRVREVARMLYIEDLLDRKPAQLSGGQQQRVALARALVRQPKVFLFDEPLSNLDAKLRIEARAFLKRLQKELKITTVYVTHDQAEAMTMADRIAVMNAGKVIQVGTPDDIYWKPTHVFVAGFIGAPSMNLVDVSYVEKEDKVYLQGPGFELDITPLASVVRPRLKHTELIMGVRPEHLEIVDRPVDPHCVPGEVYVIEPLGAETIVNVRVGDSIFKVRVLGAVKYNVGDKVYLHFDLNRVYIFDRKTGEAIII
ncbi:MAG: sugar ABC transporter ATP-binding protein [Thermoprotei archaeon]|nr:MAG: sugar ABC transporter ATP-binding protein [Thermoprotei archaeon]